MFYFIIGIILLGFVILFLGSQLRRTLKTSAPYEQPCEIPYQHIYEKIDRDSPLLQSMNSTIGCSIPKCNNVVRFNELGDSIAIEILKPIDPERHMQFYCVTHAKFILKKMQSEYPIHIFNKAIRDARKIMEE